MSEIFEKVNANAAQAAEADKIRLQEAEQEVERLQAERRRARQLKRRRANQTLLIRAIISALLIVGLMVAKGVGLIAAPLAIPCVSAVFGYIAFWLGAWVQFSWCRGGLLE